MDNFDILKAQKDRLVSAQTKQQAADLAETFADCLRTVCHHLELPQSESGPCDDATAYDRALEDADTLYRDTEVRRNAHANARWKAESDLAAMAAAVREIGDIAWRINDTIDQSEGDRYYLASTNDWNDLHAVLHAHAPAIEKARAMKETPHAASERDREMARALHKAVFGDIPDHQIKHPLCVDGLTKFTTALAQARAEGMEAAREAVAQDFDKKAEEMDRRASLVATAENPWMQEAASMRNFAVAIRAAKEEGCG